ncbi:hypothetical protein LUZ60_002001 [Juncus effusus]|nr:hypothetical protein LUZ60_002001 [Juncus effusus]
MALSSIHARLLLSSASFLRLRRPLSSPTYTNFSSLPSLPFLRTIHHSRCSLNDQLTTTTPITSDSQPEDNDKEEEKDPVREAAEALDLRVGRVVSVMKHPEADSLYVEEVDVGEAELRTICSGLVGFVPLESIQDSRVVVLANLKARNMRGIKSNGMLMAASDEAHENLELLVPPEGSVPGERIWFGENDDKDKQSNPATPNQVQKKKIWEFVQPHLKTTDDCIAVLGTQPMRTSVGVVTCKSLKNARIS